jgi:hypothetical protein
MKISELINILENYPNKEDQVFISTVPPGRDCEIQREIGGCYQTFFRSDFQTTAVVISSITPENPLK